VADLPALCRHRLPETVSVRCLVRQGRTGTTLEHVRPWCDLTAIKSAKRDKAQVAKALQTRHFARLALTPSLPAIQHRQHESLICRAFEALFRTRTGDPLLTMEVLRRYGRTRAGTREHVCPANRPFSVCRQCPRVLRLSTRLVPAACCLLAKQTTRRAAPRFERGRSAAHRRGQTRADSFCELLVSRLMYPPRTRSALSLLATHGLTAGTNRGQPNRRT
jgi:hypothetical protein